PARSSASFVTYPESQRLFEARTNAALTNITELDFDFCYGPRLLATHLLDAVLELDDAFGWGWMSIPVVAAKRAGQAIHQIVLDLPCPEEERIETGNDAAYRAMQHAQHLKAVEFACSRFRMHSGRST